MTELNGFINILKPAGMTSHDVVSALRRILGIKKIGHTGTLDPMATGVLPVCIGKATRAAEYAEAGNKTYRCELLLGMQTDTGDIWGNTILENKELAQKISKEMIEAVLKNMTGTQLQYPPKYSAIKKNGRKLYEYARNGEEVEIEPRKITIFSISPVSILETPMRAMFDVNCAKGTYIRSLCTDIGEALKCGASMSFLSRMASGNFTLDNTVTLEELVDYIADNENISAEDIRQKRRETPLTCDLSRFIIPVDSVLTDFGIIRLDQQEHVKYINGGKIAMRNAELIKENTLSREDKYSDFFIVYDEDNNFIGTAIFDIQKEIYTIGKVFVR